MYSQKPLLEFLHAGKISDESGTPKHTETVISNVYLFNERVYKVYKNDNSFFNTSFHDLSVKRDRFVFSKSDFEWNQRLTKELYLHLLGVRVGNDRIQFVDEQDAEELIFITKRMPADTTLFDLIMKGDLATNDFYEIGKQFAQREKNFIWNGVMPDESLLGTMLERYDDIVEFIKVVEKISTLEKETWTNQLKELITRVYTHDSSGVSICFDIHSLNAFYVDQTLYPFDTHPPKDTWRFGPALLSLYRLATDVLAFAGKKEFDAVISGYHEYLKREMPTQENSRLFVIYASLIMVSYLYMLGITDTDKQGAAVKYHNFLTHYIAS